MAVALINFRSGDPRFKPVRQWGVLWLKEIYHKFPSEVLYMGRLTVKAYASRRISIVKLIEDDMLRSQVSTDHS